MNPENLIQGSEEWLEFRSKFITASRMIDVIRLSKSYANKISEAFFGVIPKNIDCEAMAWGRQQESIAIAAYELKYNVECVKSGFCIHKDLKYVGCSVDRFVEKEGLVEVKAPFNSNNHIICLTSDQVPKKHIAQIQAQMWITGRKWNDFVSFDPRQAYPRDLYVKRVYADHIYHTMLEKRCKTFWQNLVLKPNNEKIDILTNNIPNLF